MSGGSSSHASESCCAGRLCGAGVPPASRRPRRPRRQAGGGGYTLVEVLVVISINTVLMAAGVSLLATLLRSEHQGRRHFDRTSGLVRLADQWRSDVAASRTGAVVPGAEGGAESRPAAVLRLQSSPDNKIEFFRDGDRLRRVEYQGPTAVRREAYPLNDLADADFSVSEAQIATLRLTFREDKSGAHDVWQIDARLARDGRFAAEEKPREKP